MKNSLGEVIYVGKAKILKNRVRQYFQNSKNDSRKVKAMVKNISEFEYIVTDSEMEALLLECNLIKKYSPRYNILLKDDKFYPFIKITINEDFPRVFVTRNYEKDGNKYYGPYTNYGAVYETIDLLKKLLPIRTCKKNIVEGEDKTRPCLNYHIKKCKAPCSGLIKKDEYNNFIGDIEKILSGKDSNILKDLKIKMNEASKNLEFEKAAIYRDKILAIKTITEKQKIFTMKRADEDFINLSCDGKDICIQIFFDRDGVVIGREHFILKDRVSEEENEIFEEFIISFYGKTAHIPKTIYVPCIQNLKLLEEFLCAKKGSKVNIKIPIKGSKKELLDMVKSNATTILEQFKGKILKENEINKVALIELASIISLEEFPERIEAYDISNIQGVDSVGSMVVFQNGKPKNSDYRRFKIKNVTGPNDYESMREILTRRFKRGLQEIKAIQDKNLDYTRGKFSVFPDIIMMDGGKGQINIALSVLEELNLSIPVCGLVKDDKHNTRGIIYNNQEITLPYNSNLMHMITRIQDEAHRFAINHHRSLRDKKALHSILEYIPNIGTKRRKELLMKFKSVENIKKASFEELLDTNGIDKKAAQSILNYFGESQKKN